MGCRLGERQEAAIKAREGAWKEKLRQMVTLTLGANVHHAPYTVHARMLENKHIQ